MNKELNFRQYYQPQPLYYELDKMLSTLYDKTIKVLSNKKEGLTYFRYQAIKYLNEDKKKKYKKSRSNITSVGRDYENLARETA